MGMKKINFQFSIFIFLIFLLLFPLITRSASFNFSPQLKNIYLEDIFLVGVWLDTEGEEINAVEIIINYPSEKLEVIDFSKGGSILTFWPREPDLSEKGRINFIGGIPGGFDGKGLIGKIVFRAITPDLAEVKFGEDSKVLLNDGLGTLAKVGRINAEFKLLSEKREAIENEWQDELEKDKNPPEPFEIKIGKDSSIFDGKYFIVFSTVDRETGIDYYEVKEGKGDWKKTGSPYLLEDQSLKSKIFVKAVDKAKNERISEINLIKKSFPYEALIFGLIFIALILWIIKKFKVGKYCVILKSGNKFGEGKNKH